MQCMIFKSSMYVMTNNEYIFCTMVESDKQSIFHNESPRHHCCSSHHTPSIHLVNLWYVDAVDIDRHCTSTNANLCTYLHPTVLQEPQIKETQFNTLVSVSTWSSKPVDSTLLCEHCCLLQQGRQWRQRVQLELERPPPETGLELVRYQMLHCH